MPEDADLARLVGKHVLGAVRDRASGLPRSLVGVLDRVDDDHYAILTVGTPVWPFTASEVLQIKEYHGG
jgi:hypothetical protein